MANYVKFKQGLKKDFNTTNQPLTNGMIYFVIDENNNGSIYYDTIVDGAQATKKGTVHRVKFSGLPIKITGSVTGTGVISKDGESIEINTSTNHSHGLAHQDFTVVLSDDDTNLKWTRLGNQNGKGFWLKSIRGQTKAPAWFLPDFSAGIAFGGSDTKGIISVKYSQPGVRFAGGNGDAPVWYFTITGANDKTYDLSKIGGHSSDSAKLDHNVTFKIASTADATNGANGTKTDLSGPAVNLYLPTKISGFDLLQASRFQGNADSATYATSAGYAKGLFLNPETRQEDMNFNLADAKYIKRVTYSMATSTTKKNKPPIGDANILSFGWDNSGYGSQLAIQNSGAGHLAVRGSDSTNGASSWGEWSTVLDSSNYTSYINNYYWANVKVSTASSTETKPTFNTAYTSNWWRSIGKTGWWNDTYSGGIAMEDKIYVKVAGNKSFFIPNGSLKIGGNGDIFFATGYDDATLKIYGQTNTKFGPETIAIQTCFDNQDPQTSEYTTQYANRCNLLLQPRGGQVYIGKNLTTPGDVEYKLLVGGNQWIEGNLVFKGAKEIKFIGSKQTFSMIRFIDNTSDAYGNGISIGGGGSTVIGAGESAMSYVTNGGDERLFLLADSSINIEAGGDDTISNRKGLQVTSDGHILPIKAENSNPNAQDLGSAADYWRNLYINNVTLQGQVGNRLVWTNGSKILQAGYHYADTDRIAINTAERQGYNFYVKGSSYFSSNTYIHRNHFLNNPSTGAGELILTALGYKNAGYPVYNDPEFASGPNSISVYNQAANGTVTHAIVSDASSGNSSGKVLKITHTGSGSPGFGGFVQYISSRANAIFIQIFRAKIPTGRNVATASNSMGDNYKDEWLTPTTGTGRWEWYARRVICGASGTFSTGGHVYIKDGAAPTTSSPLVWYLSYCNVIDITKGNYDGLRTRYSDFVIYDSGEDGKDNKTPINDKYVAKIVTKTSNGTTFTLRGLNGAGNELADAVLTIPNAGSDKAGLITNTAQEIYGEKTLHENLRFSNISTGTRGIVGSIADNDCWRVVGRADVTNQGYLEIATGDDTNEPIYMRQYFGAFRTITRTFTILDGSGRSRAPELFEAKKVHVNSKLNQSNAIADIGYQFQVTGTSNFTDNVDISGITTHHNNIQIDANYSIAKPGKRSAWYGSHTNAMIRMTSVNYWSPLLAQKATNGYWILGHYNYHNEKDENDKNSDFRDQWLFGYLSDSNLEGTTGASNSLTTTYRLLNIGDQRMFVSARYNAAVGSGTKPVYVQSNGNVTACSYSLSATIEAGTANRMAYYKAANQIGSSDHYVTSSQVGINSNTTHDFTFYVGGNSYFSNLVTVYAGNNLGIKIGNTNITAIDGSLILQNNTALRFGSSEWDWNKWAGLKYVPDSKTIVIGLADSTNFTARAVQSGGTFLFTGMSTIDLNKTASIKNLAVGGGIYWNPYVESAGDGSDAASITVIAHGAADGTELRIQQQNDANDIINLVVNNSIFLNGKRAFRPYDSWLRINEDSSFNYGIYTGSSLIRSDNQLQVGAGGNAFYANSGGNGYLSNNLIIRGKYAVNFFGSGDQTYTQSAFIINNTDGFILETPRSTNEITATNILPFRIRTRGGQPAPEFAGDRLVENNCIYNLGSKTAEFATGFIRAIAARHLDADAVFTDDHTLYIGYGNVAPTEKTAFFYSPNLSSRTQFAEINSNGLYALTRFGVNGQNTGYTCYINGTLFSGTHTVYGKADSKTAPSNFYCNGALEIRESNLVTSSQSSFNYAPRIGFHWGGRIAASLSFHNDGIFYFRKQDGSSRATIDANVNGLATNASNSINAEYVANDSAYMRFHWNPQNGQPNYLWGSNDAGNMYIYNPSNFKVRYLSSLDTRDDVINPSSLTTGVQFDFKSASNTGLTSWSGVMTYRPHGSGSNWTGGPAHQFAFHSDGVLYHRISSGDSTWGNWAVIIDSNNIGSYSSHYAPNAGNADTVDGYHADAFVKKAGDTMTGDLSFQTIGQWPAPSDEMYPINSAGIMWRGSSDYAKIYYEVAAADAGRLVFNTGDDSNCIISFRNCGTQYAYIDTQGLHGAVWNDYAECRKSNENEPGRVVLEDNFGVCQITIKRLQPFAGVISDTYGFCQGETNDAKTPLAVAGRVLVYTYQNRYNYKIGDCVCAAPNGTIDIMTREEVREYPDRIVGTVSEIPDYEVWGTGNVKVNNRIWIKVK